MEILKLKSIKFEIKFTRQAYEQYNGSGNLKTSIEAIQSEKQREKKIYKYVKRTLESSGKILNTLTHRLDFQRKRREKIREKNQLEKKDEKFPIFLENVM